MTTQTIEVTLDDAGHIFIPPAFQKRLGLSAGMMLVVKEDEKQGLRLQAQVPVVVDKDGILVVQADADEDLTDVVQQIRSRRLQEALQRVTA